MFFHRNEVCVIKFSKTEISETLATKKRRIKRGASKLSVVASEK